MTPNETSVVKSVTKNDKSFLYIAKGKIVSIFSSFSRCISPILPTNGCACEPALKVP